MNDEELAAQARDRAAAFKAKLVLVPNPVDKDGVRIGTKWVTSEFATYHGCTVLFDTRRWYER